MRRGILATLALLAPGVAGGTARVQGQREFRRANRTGYTIDEVQIGAASSSSWGRDMLGNTVLRQQQNMNIHLAPNTRACAWDIKLADADGDVPQFRQVNLCPISRATLDWNRQQGSTRSVVG